MVQQATLGSGQQIVTKIVAKQLGIKEDIPIDAKLFNEFDMTLDDADSISDSLVLEFDNMERLFIYIEEFYTLRDIVLLVQTHAAGLG